MSAQLLMSQDEIDRDRNRWHAHRRKGITASEIAAVLGISPWSSPFALFTAKQTGTEDEVDNEDVRRGNVLEPYVADVFAAQHPDLMLLPGGLYRSGERHWQMATFDRLALDTAMSGYQPHEVEQMITSRHGVNGWPGLAVYTMPVQIKTATTREEWGTAGSADIPVHYRAQALFEMDVQDATLIIVPVLFYTRWEVVTYYIERDADAEDDIALMRAEAEAFLDRLKRDDPPEIDWSPPTTRALKSLTRNLEDETVRIPAKLARRYHAALAAQKRVKRQYGQVINEMLAEAGSARYLTALVGGQEVKVATRSQFAQRSIDAAALRRQHPAAADECERTTPVDRFFPSGWAKS